MLRRNKGFTLIELVTVMAIIGVLAAVVFVNLSSAQTKARANTAKTDISKMVSQFETWSASHQTASLTTASYDTSPAHLDAWKAFWSTQLSLDAPKPPSSNIIYYAKVQGRKYAFCAVGSDLNAALSTPNDYWIGRDGNFFEAASCTI